jgi:hypothetical protein
MSWHIVFPDTSHDSGNGQIAEQHIATPLDRIDAQAASGVRVDQINGDHHRIIVCAIKPHLPHALSVQQHD